MTAFQSTLIEDYINPYLVSMASACYVERSGFQVENTGIARVTSDRTEPAQLHEIRFLHASLAGQADRHAGRLREHLKCQPKGTDPITDAMYGDDQNPPPAKTPFNLPIYFPSSE